MGDVATLVAYRPSGVPIQPFTITPNGEIRIVAPPTQKFTETWDLGTIDSINKWIPTSGGGGVAPAASVGDWGSAKPFAILWAAVSDGSLERIPRGALVIYREWYGWNGEANVGRRCIDHRLMMICAHLPRSG